MLNAANRKLADPPAAGDGAARGEGATTAFSGAGRAPVNAGRAGAKARKTGLRPSGNCSKTDY